MNLPNFLTSEILRKHASATETHGVLVILKRIANSGLYRLRCRHRQYGFEKNHAAGGHALLVPLSVWMAGIGRGAHNEATALCNDLQPTAQTPMTIQVIPWPGAENAEATQEEPSSMGINPAMFPLLSSLLEKLNAPPVMAEAVALVEKGDVEAFAAFVDGVKVVPKQPEIAPQEDKQRSAAALRQKRWRERQKAKKEAGEAKPKNSKLQTA